MIINIISTTILFLMLSFSTRDISFEVMWRQRFRISKNYIDIHKNPEISLMEKNINEISKRIRKLVLTLRKFWRIWYSWYS